MTEPDPMVPCPHCSGFSSTISWCVCCGGLKISANTIPQSLALAYALLIEPGQPDRHLAGDQVRQLRRDHGLEDYYLTAFKQDDERAGRR